MSDVIGMMKDYPFEQVELPVSFYDALAEVTISPSCYRRTYKGVFFRDALGRSWKLSSTPTGVLLSPKNLPKQTKK